MKRFKDLDSTQKKQASSERYKINMDKFVWNFQYGNNAKHPLDIVKRVEKIKVDIRFCGCYSCMNQLLSSFNQDPEIKEYIIDQSQKEVENAFYPDDGDIVINVR